MKSTVFSGFIEKLRSNRRLEILVYSALILTAVVIFAADGGISCLGSREKGGASAMGASSSRTSVEERLEDVLSSMEGAGRVRVLICPSGEAGSSLFDISSGSEGRGAYSGAIIVAEGAKDLLVASRLREAVMTALGLDAASVCVFAMDGPE